MFKMALFVASACPLLYGYDTEDKIQPDVLSITELLQLTILELSSIFCHQFSRNTKLTDQVLPNKVYGVLLNYNGISLSRDPLGELICGH